MLQPLGYRYEALAAALNLFNASRRTAFCSFTLIGVFSQCWSCDAANKSWCRHKAI